MCVKKKNEEKKEWGEGIGEEGGGGGGDLTMRGRKRMDLTLSAGPSGTILVTITLISPLFSPSDTVNPKPFSSSYISE